MSYEIEFNQRLAQWVEEAQDIVERATCKGYFVIELALNGFTWEAAQPLGDLMVDHLNETGKVLKKLYSSMTLPTITTPDGVTTWMSGQHSQLTKQQKDERWSPLLKLQHSCIEAGFKADVLALLDGAIFIELNPSIGLLDWYWVGGPSLVEMSELVNRVRPVGVHILLTRCATLEELESLIAEKLAPAKKSHWLNRLFHWLREILP